MSDTRFIIIGAALIFAGIITLGAFGHEYHAATIESDEFGTCLKYSDGKEPVAVDCSFKIFNQVAFFALVIGLVAAGAIALVKGSRGDWDSKVGPEDMAGPGRREEESSEKD